MSHRSPSMCPFCSSDPSTPVAAAPCPAPFYAHAPDHRTASPRRSTRASSATPSTPTAGTCASGSSVVRTTDQAGAAGQPACTGTGWPARTARVRPDVLLAITAHHRSTRVTQGQYHRHRRRRFRRLRGRGRRVRRRRPARPAATDRAHCRSGAQFKVRSGNPGCFTGSGSLGYGFPVPRGALLTGATVYYIDSSTTGSVYGELSRHDFSSGATYLLATKSSGAATTDTARVGGAPTTGVVQDGAPAPAG